MSADFACPVCGTHEAPTVQIGHIAICAVCGASLAIFDGEVRRAVHDDIKDLPVTDMAALKQAHADVVRLKRHA